MPKFSIIVPVYNRPDEVEELLISIQKQTFKDFEVLIIEDGSSIDCKNQVMRFANKLNIHYYFKDNTGQGLSRNYGFERAKGEWLVVFDSDCIIPEDYFEVVNKYLRDNKIDAYGGPDKAHGSFTLIQKAISYSMTSFFTTGGIRGGKNRLGTFHPRSFNMGIRKEVFEKTKGYILPRKGEDIEFSIRIIEQGFKTALIEGAFVFHKRRTNFRQFFKQLHFFGTARINVFRFYPKELKFIHFFPSVFVIGLFIAIILSLFGNQLGFIGLIAYSVYFITILIDSVLKTKDLRVAILSVIASCIQLTAYGIGLLREGLIYLRRG